MLNGFIEKLISIYNHLINAFVIYEYPYIGDLVILVLIMFIAIRIVFRVMIHFNRLVLISTLGSITTTFYNILIGVCLIVGEFNLTRMVYIDLSDLLGIVLGIEYNLIAGALVLVSLIIDIGIEVLTGPVILPLASDIIDAALGDDNKLHTWDPTVNTINKRVVSRFKHIITRVKKYKPNMPYVMVYYIIVYNVVSMYYYKMLNYITNSIGYKLANSSLYIKIIVVKIKFSYVNKVIFSQWSSKPAIFKIISKSTKLANLRSIILRKRLDSIRLYKLELRRRKRITIKLRLRLSKGKINIRKTKLR